ncbi:helicase HerA domain-containing protein [Rhodoplanes sp. Z2-YC6860]|uniref:helicase HerA domain-containing protein n=1 Tax=Rhodoplanes sp. Z2-YC6860 TaxID=674703 RepID=UPI00078B7064|nr:DUF87 domain-containing protein [Rhodoplanes sp. Z2-YC6860]AMN44710.1 hypothetical protein RHPLAN_63010 [Rhodoplanes sp. Z2-YC6860]
MRARFRKLEAPGVPGVRVKVVLEIEPKEYDAIVRFGILDKNVAFSYNFRDFFNTEKIIKSDSPREADTLINLLTKGFNQINEFIGYDIRGPQTEQGVAEPEPLEEVPWDFFEDKRFEHMLIMAGTGTGKTTLLSAMINKNLDQVARGEASVVVIDSENEDLGRFLPRHPRFAPGGDLHGKLVYLEPSMEYPPCLNILQFADFARLSKDDQFIRLQQASEMLAFFFGAMGTELSTNMNTILNNSLMVLAHIPNATFAHFDEILSSAGFARLSKEHAQLRSLPQNVIKFFSRDIQGSSMKQSADAVRQRLNSITQNLMLKAIFAEADRGLDLFKFFQQPRVLIVNTQKRYGEETTGTFGRYFFAALLGVIRQRSSGGLPIYFYADEAYRYLVDEGSAKFLVKEGRRQNVSITLAIHEIEDARGVLSALQTMHIKALSMGKPRWQIKLRVGDPQIITPPNISFRTAPQIDRLEWEKLHAAIRAAYCRDNRDIAPPPIEGQIEDVGDATLGR